MNKVDPRNITTLGFKWQYKNYGVREKELHSWDAESPTWTWQSHSVMLKIWSAFFQFNNMFTPIVLCLLLKLTNSMELNTTREATRC
jgi:hypothetical protein